MAEHVKFEAPTDPRHGCPPAERGPELAVRYGVVPLDKPAGPTSRVAADRVRYLLNADKAGHGGTLDPAVTGVLPVLLGRSTRTAQVFLGCDKTYVGTMTLHGDVPQPDLRRALQAFRGVIRQVPPRRSAVKRQERKREVYTFRLTAYEGRRVGFEVECEGGTYIRKLIHDLGQHLGCGAHMSQLRRTRAGGFGIEECAITRRVERAARALADGDPDALRGVVVPVEEALRRLLPAVWIADGAVEPVCTGYPLAAPGVSRLEDFRREAPVVVLTLKGELVALGRALMDSAAVLAAERGLAVAPEQVVMEAGTYPKPGTGR